MNHRRRLILAVAALLITVAGVQAAPPVVTSFSGNGLITWTNSATSGVYRVQWAPSMTSEWSSSWQPLRKLEGHTNTTFSVSVPMFYRIAWNSNLPPAGMPRVGAGVFLMGDNYTDQSHFGVPYPVHEVWTDAYYIDRYEISDKRWAIVRNWGVTNGYSDLAVGASYPLAEDHPITMITWYDSVKWCNARSERDGLTPVYYTDTNHMTVYRTGTVDLANDNVNWEASGYRLPTEAEWEKAARGGLTGHHFPWPSFGGDYSNHWDGSKANAANSGDPYDNDTTPVGYFNGSQTPEGDDMANGFGLYDMEGNVNEWCWDWHDDSYYSSSPYANPRGPASSPASRRAIRGGAYDGGPIDKRCSYRDNHWPSGAYFYNGFRCAKGD